MNRKTRAICLFFFAILLGGVVAFTSSDTAYFAANAVGGSDSIFEGGGLKEGLDRTQTELNQTGIRTQDASLIKTIAAFLNFILPFAAIIAVAAFIISGFIFILGFGSDMAIQRARKIMIWSAVGLIVIIFSYPAVRFIISFTTAP